MDASVILTPYCAKTAGPLIFEHIANYFKALLTIAKHSPLGHGDPETCPSPVYFTHKAYTSNTKNSIMVEKSIDLDLQ